MGFCAGLPGTSPLGAGTCCPAAAQWRRPAQQKTDQDLVAQLRPSLGNQRRSQEVIRAFRPQARKPTGQSVNPTSLSQTPCKSRFVPPRTAGAHLPRGKSHGGAARRSRKKPLVIWAGQGWLGTWPVGAVKKAKHPYEQAVAFASRIHCIYM